MPYAVSLSIFFWMSATVVGYGQRPVFTAGMGGYTQFRMPTLVRLGSGELLAFCEARTAGRDSTARVVLMRSSTTDGRRWSPMRVVFADDTLRMWQLHRRGGLSFDNGKTLVRCRDADPVHRDSLSLRRSSDGGATWGPAMLIDGGGTPFHTGDGDLVDLGGGNLGVLYERDSLHAIIFTEVDGVIRDTRLLSRRQWEAVEGIYQLKGNPEMFIRFTDREGELVAGFLWDLRDSLRFLPDSPLVFIEKDAGSGARSRIRFRQDARGRVDGVTMGNGSMWGRVDRVVVPVENLRALAGNYQSMDDPDDRIAISLTDSNQLAVRQAWDGLQVVLTPLSGSYFYSAKPFFTLEVLFPVEGGQLGLVKIMGRYKFSYVGK